MAQPVWKTPAGSLGVIPETKFYRNTVVAVDPDGGAVTYSVISGTLPDGIQFSGDTGTVSGTPNVVNFNTVSKFTVRASTVTLPKRIADRTFTLTITGDNTPLWTTPSGSLGTFYSGQEIDFQFAWDDNDPNDVVVVRLASGELPGGLTLSPSGLLTGYIQPAMDLGYGAPGYGNTGQDLYPYDFVARTVNKNYEFTLEVTDGVNSDLRTFYMFVYTRQSLTADTTVITADNTYITADETNVMSPFIANADPSNLGLYRSDNYFAYQFIGENYSGDSIIYAISVNQGYGLVPGLELDPSTGWYYGYIPDQGATEVEYSFNIVTYLSQYQGTPINCIKTNFGTNVITCDSTAQLGVGQPIVFSGSAFGGISSSPLQVYYVSSILGKTKFTVTTVLGSSTTVELTTATGTMQANLIAASRPYPFTLTVTGVVDNQITWLTATDLGVIDNGSTSLLRVEAVNTGGRTLRYRLKSGAYNSLPQGLELLPTGDISGRVSFNGFSIDLGTTTFDETFAVNRNLTTLGTTFDSTFRFTVNAYAPESLVPLYNVRSVIVENGGSGYSSLNPPTITFSTPIGASAVVAQVGNIVISGGSIVSVTVIEPGYGYTSTPTITVVDPYGGTGAELTPIMQLSGINDAVSVFKEFRVRVFHRWTKPYQNLLLRAMPPLDDRQVLWDFLHDENIFVPEWIFRAEDPFFGVAKDVTFVHTYGLLPESLDLYVQSLYLNHYWKNLVLGSIKTAQALDANGNVLYEVVYSDIIDNLVNNEGISVGKIVNLPYVIQDPIDRSDITQVYPNSLVDMRNQVIDVVGQIDGCGKVPLPLWMTSKQVDGRILGYVPGWVMAYTVPGRSNQIAYYIKTKWQGHLNEIDFTVDRYILDSELSKNWDPETQQWVPNPGNITTFDIYGYAQPLNFVQNVNIATELAFVDINQRPLEYINSLGGLDGIISNVNNNTLIFVKQEGYEPPLPGNYPAWNQNLAYPAGAIVTNQDLYYSALHNVPAGTDITDLYYWYPGINTDAAWQNYLYPYDTVTFSQPPETYDESVTVPGGDSIECYETYAATNIIRCDSTSTMWPGQEVVFTSGVIGGIVQNQIYYILDIIGFTEFRITATKGSTTPVSLANDTGFMIAVAANERMAIYKIVVDPATKIVTLELLVQTDPWDWVQITRGATYNGVRLYYPPTPAQGYTHVNWATLVPDQSNPTTFDQGSMQFIDPVDMYDPGERYDRYLVFPKHNILGNPPDPVNPHLITWLNNQGHVVRWINNVGYVVQWSNV